MRKTFAKAMGLAAGMLVLTALSGCDWLKSPEPQPSESANAANEAEPENVVVPVGSTPPQAANAAAPAVEDTREAPPPPDAQTIDDADATGMTAHVRRDEATGNTTETP